MDAIANTILKYDGCIWGPWVHYKIGGGPEPKMIHCRFVTRNIFIETMSLPHQFLIDLKQNFKVISVKGREIKIGDFTIVVDIHGPADELKFMEEVDFTCNLIDISRSGIGLRTIPKAIAYEVNPFETVVEHIKERVLVPLHLKSALLHFKTTDWKCDNIGKIDTNDVCGICQGEIETGVRTLCNHDYHIECLLKWLDRSSTCPMCRDVI
jgi:hypothetical protein